MVRDRLPDASLVELGVADQRDEAARIALAEVRVDVAAYDAGEQRRRRAETDGAREVDDVGVRSATGTPEPSELSAGWACGRGCRAGTGSSGTRVRRAA
jgi:hypothetical protein